MSVGRQAFHPFVLARRASLAGKILGGMFALLIAQFFRLQIVEHDKYQLRSDTNRLRPIPLPAPRGLILDRKGQIIAENVPGYSVLLLAYSDDSLQAMLDRLRPIVSLDSESIRRVFAHHRAAPFEPALVVKDASFDLIARLEEHRSVLPGLVIQAEPKRSYPDSTVVAHLVGYVGEVTEPELATPEFEERRPGSIVGKSGLERQYEDSLKGSDGVRFVEVDALGRVVREEGAPTLTSVTGHALQTTIDLDLQRYVDSIWPKQYSGALIAMEPATGAIRAFYSYPAYNPNDFVGGIPRALWARLNDDPDLPLLNRAIGTRYPPGSTFKLATAMIALQRGLVNFSTHMAQPCRGGYRFGNRFFKCWKPQGHGSLDLLGAITNSCDAYFYQLGRLIGVANFVRDGSALGFDSTTGVDLPGELHSAFPPSTEYYDRIYGRGRWTEAVSLNLAIGQGENAQSLINMVRFYAALGNGGRVPVPYVVAPRHAITTTLTLPDTAFLGLRNALISVVEEGTARVARLGELHLAGKTGTAQNTNGANHGWFIGFAPAEAPRIVVGVILEHGLHGTNAAPIVARAVERYLLGPDSSLRPRGRLRVRVPEDTAAAPRVLPLPVRPDTSKKPASAPRPIARVAGR
ncbi:MAG: penicillin-binding protein 2 [Gemmatimonadales bacterium]